MSESLVHRTQILLDDRRRRRLEELSQTTGDSVGALVREAIDIAYPDVTTDRAAAVERLLAADPIDMGPGGWPAIKEEMLRERIDHLTSAADR